MSRRRVLAALCALLVLGAVLVGWPRTSSRHQGVDTPARDVDASLDDSPDVAERSVRVARGAAPGTVPGTVPGAQGVAVRIQVIHAEDDSPIVGARVRLWRGTDETDLGWTDDTGSVVVQLDDTGADVVVRAAGFVRGYRRIKRPAKFAADGLLFELEPALCVTGRVLAAESDEELGVALVRVTDGAMGAGGGHMSTGPSLGEWSADEEGTFRVDVPSDRGVTLEVSAPGRIPVSVVHDAGRAADADPLVVHLSGGGTFFGVLTGPDGAPVAGAVVWVHTSEARALARAPATSWRTTEQGVERARNTVTAMDGSWRLTGELLGVEHDLFAEAEGHARSAHSAKRVATVDGTGVDLRLRAPAVLDLSVVDPDGAPVSSANVGIRSDGTNWVWSGGADDGDTFPLRIAGLDIGSHVATVSARFGPPVHARFTTREGDTAAVRVVVRESGYVEGQVVDDLDTPCAGLSVECISPGGEALGARTKTGADGAYFIGGLSAKSLHVVVRSEEGAELGRREFVKASAAGLRLVAPRRASLTARLLLPPGGMAPQVVSVVSRGVAYSSPWNDGSVRFDGLTPGEYFAVSWQIDGYLGPEPEWVYLRPAETYDVGAVALDAGRVVRGRVTDSAGAPIEDAEVSTSTCLEYTDEDGHFELERVRSTDVVLEVEAEGYVATTAASVAAVDGPVVITLTRVSRVVCIVRLPEDAGIDPDDLLVEVVDPAAPDTVLSDAIAEDADDDDDQAGAAGAAASGVRFVFELAPGRRRFELFWGEHLIARTTADIRPGIPARIDLTPADPR